MAMNDVKDLLAAQKTTDGDDWIKGYNTGEVLTGGKGDDVLEGLTGADHYHYTRGDGYDVIIESASETGDVLYLHGVV
jgi:Ca2+-binding RTX toxin-like protein